MSSVSIGELSDRSPALRLDSPGATRLRGPGFPSLARVRYLSFFPLMLAARDVSARRHLRGAASSAWLDGAVRSPGPTSVLPVLLSRRLGEVPMGGRCGVQGAGLLIFAATDVTYGLQVTAGTYVLATSLDAG